MRLHNLFETIERVGNRIVAYHGTHKEFDQFNLRLARNGSFGRGIYFSTDIRDAQSFGDRIIKVLLDIHRPYVTQGLLFDDDGMFADHGVAERIRSQGFDAVIYDQGDVWEIVLFDLSKVEIIERL